MLCVVLCGVCRCGRGVVGGRGVCLVCVFVCVCVCLCVLRHAEKVEKPVFGFKNASVCTFKTSPCMPAPRAHVLKHVRVVPVHTETF